MGVAAMTDDAYINPSERGDTEMVVGVVIPSKTWYQLFKSHAVVDSVAAELADALRHRLKDCHCDYAYMCPSHKALQRFDNLTKGTE